MVRTFIGIGHYSRVGKDSFANRLLSEFETRGIPAAKRSFAWKLKDICHQLYSWDGLREPEFYETPEGAALRNTPLPTVGKSPVEIWIDMGTPAVREHVYEDTWIQYVLRNAGEGITIIPDVRFPNEANFIRENGGSLIKVIRPGFPPRDSVADRALLGFQDWDLVLGQSGELADLYATAGLIADTVAASGKLPRQSLEARNMALRIERKTIQDAGMTV